MPKKVCPPASRKPLFLLCLLILPGLTGCSPTPRSAFLKKGELDLRDTAWRAAPPVSIEGEWEFYHERFLPPVPGDQGRPQPDTFLTAPDAWNGQPGPEGPLPGRTWGTYRAVLHLDENTPPLGLKLMEMCTAYRLYINGRLTAANGSPGPSLQSSIPRFRPLLAPLPSNPPGGDSPGQVEILLHIANFRQRVGGAWGQILLAPTGQLLDRREKTVALELFLAGALLIMSAYHLVLFLFRRQARAALTFSLITLLLGIRTLITGERFLIQILPQVSWTAFTYMEYFTFYLLGPLFLLFFSRLYPREFHRPFLRISLLVCAVFNGIVLTTPSFIFTHTIYAYQGLSLVLGVYLIGVLFRALRHRREGAVVFSIGMAALFLALVNDILNSNGVLHSGILAPQAAAVFIFAQALVLAQRFTGAMERTEVYAREIRELNRNLERKVLERTSALKEMAQRDSLTQLYNHGAILKRLEEQILLVKRYGRPLSILMLDIDHFKKINDSWGHQQGDIILKQSCRVIQQSLRDSDLAGRYGGEEFLIILPETQLEDAIHAAERIRSRIEKLGPTLSPPIRFTVSGGIADFRDNISAEEMIDQADKHLYRAKEGGRNRVVRRS